MATGTVRIGTRTAANSASDPNRSIDSTLLWTVELAKRRRGSL